MKQIYLVIFLYVAIAGIIGLIYSVARIENSASLKSMQSHKDPTKVAFCKGAGFDDYGDFGINKAGIITIRCVRDVEKQWGTYEWPTIAGDNGSWK